MKRFLSILLALMVMCSLPMGCASSGGEDKAAGGTSNSNAPDSAAKPAEAAEAAKADFAQADGDMFTNRDLDPGYDADGGVLIQLNGSSAEASADSVRISGSTVTITEDGTYIISGELSDGMIIVDAPDTAKLQLVLNGANINNETSAPLYILEADKVFITLADGTENALSNGGTFAAIDESSIDAALFSKQDITLNGSGSLTVTSPAGHGVVSKDDLVITGGTYKIASASHGLDANDSVRITGDTSLAVDSGKDGIHAENNDDASRGFVYISGGTTKIEAEGDGIDAGAYMQIESGTVDILAGGGSENGAKAHSDSWGGFMGGGNGRKAPGFKGGENIPEPRDGENVPEVPEPRGGENIPEAPEAPEPKDGFAGGMPEQAGQAQLSEEETEDSVSMKGLKAEGGILISGGSFTIDSADDAIHSNLSVTINGGSFELASGDDAVHADEALTVTAGSIDIAESYEGLEALNIDIRGGDISLAATDDGVNAAGGTDSSGTAGGRDGMFGGGAKGQGMPSSNGSIVISGGSLYVNASGDGLDANGSLSITGGSIVVSGANSGDTSILDFDSTGTISGGIFIGTGASGMAQNFSSSSTQGAIMVNAEGSEGTAIELADSSGKVLLSHKADQAFSCVIVSCPEILKGGTYTLTVGSSAESITMSETVYGSGGSGGMGKRR